MIDHFYTIALIITLVLLLQTNANESYNASDIIHLEGKCVAKGGRYHHAMYIVKNGTKHILPDKYTIFAVGCNAYHLMPNHEFSTFQSPIIVDIDVIPTGPPMPSRWDNRSNKKLLSLLQSQPNIVKEYCPNLMRKLNPSVIYVNHKKSWLVGFHHEGLREGRFIMVPGNVTNTTRLSDGASLCQSMDWLKKLDDHFSFTHVKFPMIEVKSGVGDPRLIELTGDTPGFYGVFSVGRKKKPEIQPSFIKFYSDDTNPFYMQDQVWVSYGMQDEKNWTPFEYKSQLYFIYSIAPFQIVKVDINPTQTWLATAQSISFQNVSRSCLAFEWAPDWHSMILRGGTQALPLKSDKPGVHKYVGLFHSYSNLVEENDFGVLKTYLMGVYTFEVEEATNSFYLTGVSKYPIIHESWYSGHWLYRPNAFGMIDYVVYPMSIMLEDDNIFAMIGVRDEASSMVKLSLSEALASLIKIPRSGQC